MPGSVMCMWPRLFLWPIIIKRGYLGIHRPQINEVSVTAGLVCKNSLKLTLQEILSYYASHQEGLI